MIAPFRAPSFPRCWAPGCSRQRHGAEAFCARCSARLPDSYAQRIAVAWDDLRHAEWRAAITTAHGWLAANPLGARM